MELIGADFNLMMYLLTLNPVFLWGLVICIACLLGVKMAKCQQQQHSYSFYIKHKSLTLIYFFYKGGKHRGAEKTNLTGSISKNKTLKKPYK
jgi:hypothetical protein